MQYDLLARIDASCFFPFQACMPIHVWCQAYLPTAVFRPIYQLHYRFQAILSTVFDISCRIEACYLEAHISAAFLFLFYSVYCMVCFRPVSTALFRHSRLLHTGIYANYPLWF
jgi:hypothetical protein